MNKELEFLKERAREFWQEGLRLFKEEKYNLAAFHIEQTIQLWMKYLIGVKIGDWPKTHYFSELIKELAKAREQDNILDFYQKKELFFDSFRRRLFYLRRKIRTKIKLKIGSFSPFQIHLVNPVEYRWYQNFIKNDYLVI
jgi:hypothetical protein